MGDLERSLKNLMNERLDPLQPQEVQMRSIRQATMRRFTTGASILVGGAALVAAGWWGASAWEGRSDIDPAGGELYICRVETSSAEMTLFLRDDTTESDRMAISEYLSNNRAVLSVTYMTNEEAFEEFKERYKDQPQFYENLPEGALPASFRVDLAEDADAEALSQLLQALSGVDDIRYSDLEKRPCLPIEPYDG